MKIVAGIVATVYFAATGLLLIWGLWLLTTDDPDGARHPSGAAMLGVGLLSAVLGIVAIRWSRRP
jgi:hypothetical protein